MTTKPANITFLPSAKGTLDVIHRGDGFTLIDACVPNALADQFVALFQQYGRPVPEKQDKQPKAS